MKTTSRPLCLRLRAFHSRNPNGSWFGFWFERNYHDIIFAITIFTYELGVTYIRKESDTSIKKSVIAWEL